MGKPVVRAVPFIAAAALAAVAALVVVAGNRLVPTPSTPAGVDSASVPTKDNEADLRWHRAAAENGRQARTTATEAPTPNAPPVQGLPPIAPPALSSPLPLRAIEPSVVAVPRVGPGELERVDPRPSLSELSKAPKPLLFQPVAEAAGVIAAGGRTLTIAGVEPLTDSETCQLAGGGEWPCGRAARTAFRGLLRARAVTCDFPEGEVADDATVPCRVGRRDIGAWLVENGWARAADDTYLAEARAAREAGRGIYGACPGSLPAAPSATTSSIVPDATQPASAPETGNDAPASPPGDISILPPAALEPGASTTFAVETPNAPTTDVPDAAFPPPPQAGVNALPPPSFPRP